MNDLGRTLWPMAIIALLMGGATVWATANFFAELDKQSRAGVEPPRTSSPAGGGVASRSREGWGKDTPSRMASPEERERKRNECPKGTVEVEPKGSLKQCKVDPNYYAQLKPNPSPAYSSSSSGVSQQREELSAQLQESYGVPSGWGVE